MLGFQLLIALFLCGVLKRWFSGIAGLEVPDFSWDTLVKSLPPGLLFTLNMVIGVYYYLDDVLVDDGGIITNAPQVGTASSS